MQLHCLILYKNMNPELLDFITLMNQLIGYCMKEDIYYYKSIYKAPNEERSA